MNKYAAIRRSHLLLAIHTIDRDLEHLKSGGAKHSALMHERSELQAALQERNAELLNRWEKGILYGHFCAAELARFEQSSKHEYEIASRNRGSVVDIPDILHVAKRARVSRPIGSKQKHGTRNKSAASKRHKTIRHSRSSRR